MMKWAILLILAASPSQAIEGHEAVTAASVGAGSLGSGVIVSSLAVNAVYPAAVSAGTYSNITGVGTQGTLSVTGAANVGVFTVDSASATVEGQLLVTPGAGVAATSPVLDITSQTATTKLFQVFANGKAALGAPASVSDALTILPANNTGIMLRESDDGYSAGQWYSNTESSLIRLNRIGTTTINLNGWGGPSYFNVTSQNFGIGTITPNQTLHVVGTSHISGASTFASSATFTSSIQTDGFLQTFSRTQAQIEALTPAAVGQVYYCSDCTLTTLCISTGTALSAFGSAVAPGTDCD